MLIYEHLEKGYEPVIIRSEISEGKKLFNPFRKQVFYFDDFLGQTFLRDRQGFLLKNQDVVLADFFEMVTRSKSARFILTTREHILRNALLGSERLKSSSILENRCMLQLSDYSFGQKARILYNHLYFSDLPVEYKQQILKDEYYIRAIKHRNFSPRVIEWMSGYAQVRSTPPELYPALFESMLENPEGIWRHAFDNQISEASRNILLTLFTLAGQAPFDRLEEVWSIFHRAKAAKYNFSMSPNDFRSALKELEGAFIIITRDGVQFINPSIKDFLSALISEVHEHAVDLLATADRFDQIARIWQITEARIGANFQSFLAKRIHILLKALERNLANPEYLARTENEYTYRRTYDVPLEARANLLVSISMASKSPKMLELLDNTIARTLAKWTPEYPDYDEAIELLKSLSDTPEYWASDMYERVKSGLLPEFRAATSVQYEALLEHKRYSSQWTEHDNSVLAQAFTEYVDDHFAEERREYSSSDELVAFRDNILNVAEQLGADVSYEIDRIESDIPGPQVGKS